MLLKYFYDQKLAHASYMVGCQRANVAVVVDPGRDIDKYLEMADREGLKLTAVAETHIHADYVSGARELADRVGAKLYISNEGPTDWKYLFADQYDHQLVKDGDSFMIGNIKFDVLATPGHTPESISFVLTDKGGGADKPMGIFTGDFVFVGSIGRPDLLEKAAGLANTAEAGARELFHSAEKFKRLPDYLQVWPAHGAGSACGKGLGAIPSSTVGYEKLFNPALQFTDEDKFVKYILSDQPEAPKYFAVMKRVNKEGPALIGDSGLPGPQPIDKLKSVLESATVIDLSASDQFAKGHVPRTLNIPTAMLAGWAGWVVDYSKPVYLIAASK
ncbi:MAG: MBL fold metallo-hydrolase, partial [Aureliella sp.]